MMTSKAKGDLRDAEVEAANVEQELAETTSRTFESEVTEL